METVLEFEPKTGTNKLNLGWWQMVTIESGGIRHVLTSTWRTSTRAKAKEIAKREGIRFVELEAGK